MGKLLLAVIIGVGLVWGYNTYGSQFKLPSLPGSFSSLFSMVPALQKDEGYGYRCADGTEFTMTTAADLSTITLHPSTSAERIPQATLNKVKSDSGARYEGGGVVFAGKGESVQLIGPSFSTVCTPTPSQTEAPFNWGD